MLTDASLVAILALVSACYGGYLWYRGIYEDCLGELRSAKISGGVLLVYALFPMVALATQNVWWVAGELILPIPLVVLMGVARHRAESDLRRNEFRSRMQQDRGDAYVDPPRPIIESNGLHSRTIKT